MFGRKKDKEITAKPIMVLEHGKNNVELWPNKITLHRHGLMNAVNVGLTGDKDIYLTTITGIQVMKPGITTGYIQFMAGGNLDNKGGVTGAVKDENTILFTGKNNYATAMELKAKIEELLHKPVPSIAPPASTADELAKLAALRDQGILTDQEFTEQKSLLLSGKS